MRWFYKYYYFFGYLCVGAEFSYVLAYVLQFTGNYSFHSFLEGLLVIFLPGCALKQAVNFMQLASACYAIASNDADNKNKYK